MKSKCGHEDQTAVPRGVEGDSRGLDKENKGRGVPFEMRASVLQAASRRLRTAKKLGTGRLAVNCNATRTDGCAAVDAAVQLTDSE